MENFYRIMGRMMDNKYAQVMACMLEDHFMALARLGTGKWQEPRHNKILFDNSKYNITVTMPFSLIKLLWVVLSIICLFPEREINGRHKGELGSALHSKRG